MLRAVAFCARAYVKFKSSGTVRCERESFNPNNPYAVATLNGAVVVGHVLQVISATCSAFIRRGDVASCEVTGGRQYSADLP